MPMNICASAEHRLLTESALAQLRHDEGLASLVRAMHAEDSPVAEQVQRLGVSSVHLACQRSMNALLEGAGAESPATTLDPVEFAQAIYKLPRTPRTAPIRRIVREIARVYARASTKGLRTPKRPDDFHALWECAMEGEPRWSKESFTPKFRASAARILNGQSLETVLQVCIDPADYETELARLLAFLRDESLELEVRAACGYALFEWIHPFVDGNGHVGRMLALSLLQDSYSLPTMVCFSSALVWGKLGTSRLFAPLRSGDGTLVDFCRGTLEQLHAEQALALGVVAEA